MAGRIVTFEAKPTPFPMDTSQTAVLVVDMQNDFGAENGLFHLAGVDTSMIRAAVAPTKRVLTAARTCSIKIVYLKMGFKADLSDAGAEDSVNRARHLWFGVGRPIIAPDGTESRALIRDTWNTDIIMELASEPGDIVLYKHRFSGFYETELDAVLKQLGIKYLIMTGCTTSICVESTIRDAMFRDYLPVVLADCTGEPIGCDLVRSNHEASLLLIERLFGWVSNSEAFISAVECPNAGMAAGSK